MSLLLLPKIKTNENNNNLGQSWRRNNMTCGADKFGRLAKRCNRYTISALKDRDIQDLVLNLVKNISGFLRVSVDAFYSTRSSATVFDTESGEVVVKTKTSIIWPNSWGSVNTTEFIRNENDIEDLIDEIKPANFEAAVLRNTFHRRDVFGTSNVRLHRILAFQVVLQSYPISFLFK